MSLCCNPQDTPTEEAVCITTTLSWQAAHNSLHIVCHVTIVKNWVTSPESTAPKLFNVMNSNQLDLLPLLFNLYPA